MRSTGWSWSRSCEASAKIDVARLLTRSCVEALSGNVLDYTAHARHRLHAVHAVRQCGEAAVAESSPLNVLLRDMQTALRGVEPNITPLL